MEKIRFDSGVKAYKLGDLGVLRFNPGDPNLYARFMEAAEKMAVLEEEMTQKAKNIPEADGAQIVKLLQEADRKMKQTLNWVFGNSTDFDALLGGVNLLAMGANGERVVSNLFAALEPILLDGAKAYAGEQAKAAKDRAAARRKGQ